jgi:hypothetical protein
MGSEKRPFNMKKTGGIYANAIAQNNKGLANIKNGHAHTHTNGFNFHPAGGIGGHKFSNSIYGEDGQKPKIGGKDLAKALGSSNGFSSGYGSDPYTSMMSQGGYPLNN